MTEFHTWDPSEIDVLVGGVPMSGFAEDSVVTYEEDEEAFAEVVGVDGDVTRSRREGVRGTLTISLMNSSRSNDILSALHALDRNTSGGAGVTPVLVRDKNGTTVIATDKAWVKGFPPSAMGRGAYAREWKLRVINAAVFLGGSA